MENDPEEIEESAFEVEEEWSSVDSQFADEFDEEEEPEDEPEDEHESIAADPPVHSYRGPREKVIFSINPAFYPVSSSYVLSTFAALLLVMIIAYFNGGFLLSLGCALVTFVPSVIKHIRHIHTIFTLTTIKLEVSEGLFSKSTRNIPLRHIRCRRARELQGALAGHWRHRRRYPLDGVQADHQQCQQSTALCGSDSRAARAMDLNDVPFR